jgi:hypothetical protein
MSCACRVATNFRVPWLCKVLTHFASMRPRPRDRGNQRGGAPIRHDTEPPPATGEGGFLTMVRPVLPNGVSG